MPELKAKYQIRSGGDAGRNCVPVIVVRPFWTRLHLPIGEISQRVIGRSRTVDPAREGLIPYGSTDLTIGKAARKAGVGVETIRFYERRGLMEQSRKPVTSGFRTYSDETVARIRFIRQAQELGFSLREAGELLGLKADPAVDAAVVRERAATKLAQVEDKIEQLERIRRALEALIAACPGSGALRACSIMEALDEARPGGNGPEPRHEEERL